MVMQSRTTRLSKQDKEQAGLVTQPGRGSLHYLLEGAEATHISSCPSRLLYDYLIHESGEVYC